MNENTFLYILFAEGDSFGIVQITVKKHFVDNLSPPAPIEAAYKRIRGKPIPPKRGKGFGVYT
ncbi:hypothetical protein [Acetivibrio cellulolyticus]